MEDKLKPVINNGLRLDLEIEEQDGSERQFGALSQPGIANIPVEQRTMYLPKGEKQYAVEDSQACASFAPCNALEMQFTWLVKNKKLSEVNRMWLQENGYITPEGRVEFSDRWIAIKSNTTKTGNSLIAPLRAVRDFGMVPNSMFPAPPDFTFAQYHDKSKLTQKMHDVGKAFKERFEINYEQVWNTHMAEAVKDDPIVVAGYAWLFPVDGVYPPSDRPFNHAFILYALPKFQAFDNYLDEGREEDFTKNLSPDYVFYQHGYRLFISKENTPSVPAVNRLRDFLERFVAWIKAQPATVDYNATLYDAAYSSIGYDISPHDVAPDELGCAESLSKVIQKAFPYLNFPTLIATRTLYSHLTQSPSFKMVTDPIKGDIIISVTGTGNGSVSNGHTGIIGKTHIMSNHSPTGTWEPNYTLQTWKDYYEKKGGMATLFFRRV